MAAAAISGEKAAMTSWDEGKKGDGVGWGLKPSLPDLSLMFRHCTLLALSEKEAAAA